MDTRTRYAVGGAALLTVILLVAGAFTYQPSTSSDRSPAFTELHINADGQVVALPGEPGNTTATTVHDTARVTSRTVVREQSGYRQEAVNTMVSVGSNEFRSQVAFRDRHGHVTEVVRLGQYVNYSTGVWYDWDIYSDDREYDRGGTVIRRDNSTVSDRVLVKYDHVSQVNPASGEAVPEAYPSLPGSRVTSFLRYPAYEQNGTTSYAGQQVAVYEPRSVWRADEYGLSSVRSDFRVYDVSGEVYVDSETGYVYYADVDYRVTASESLGSHYLKRAIGPSTSFSVDYAYTPSPNESVTRPPWAVNQSESAGLRPDPIRHGYTSLAPQPMEIPRCSSAARRWGRSQSSTTSQTVSCGSNGTIRCVAIS